MFEFLSDTGRHSPVSHQSQEAGIFQHVVNRECEVFTTKIDEMSPRVKASIFRNTSVHSMTAAHPSTPSDRRALSLVEDEDENPIIEDVPWSRESSATPFAKNTPKQIRARGEADVFGDLDEEVWSYDSTWSREGPDPDIGDSVVRAQLAELRKRALADLGLLKPDVRPAGPESPRAP